MKTADNELQQPSTSAIIDGTDLSALIEDVEDDDEWLLNVNLEDNQNKSHNRSLNPTSNLDESADDFDKNCGNSWIFPIGYEKREYQFDISRSCLFTNTLVCLPTGLGKTFIASVVIYNFYRWFPRCKIIFMAHSRPLVNQQIDACYQVVGIPQDETVELTGKIPREKRMEHWNSKRVFFATPQVIQNDINDPNFPVNAIKLVVVDEAHKAKGKFAYCEVIKGINAVNTKFRVVALSATPGKTQDVIEIIQNLLIAKIEVRTEKSLDVRNYTFTKEIVVEKVKLGELESIRDRYMQLADPYLRKLLDSKAISSNNFNKGWIIIQQKNFLAQNPPNKAEVQKIFSVVISLLYSLDLLERHGLQIFLASFKDDSNVTNLKYFVMQDRGLKALLDELNEKYKDTNPLALNINPLPNGDIPTVVDTGLYYGHPKYALLKTKILEFFDAGGTKTIIFCEFRDTVQLVFTMLLQLRPKILPRMLIGQGGAVSQKDQLAVMKDFRSNKVNVLVTTSVCEEGIDVGEVDMVICFDINSKNPTRFVQRIGRTGRKRNGKVIILATEGKEEEVIRDVIGSKDRLNKSIHSNKEIAKSLYRNAPRLVPMSFLPKCVETRFNIPVKEEVEVKAKGKKVAVKKAAAVKVKSIALHFKPVEKSASDDIMNNNDDAMEVDVAEVENVPFDVPLNFSLEKARNDFKEEVAMILSKIVDNEPMAEYLKYCSKVDLKLMDDLIEIFHEPIEESSPVELKFDCESSLDDSIEVFEDFKVLVTSPVPQKLTPNLPKPKELVESQDYQFIDVESRYGNQFSIPEPFNTPFKNSRPFQPVNQIMNSSVKSTPSPVVQQSLKKSLSGKKTKVSVENSPLVRAFEKQRNLMTSTPNVKGIVMGFVTPERVEGVSKANMSTVGASTRLKASSTVGTPFGTFSKLETSSHATTSHAESTENQKKTEEKTALEFFGLASIDDIFEGFDDEDDDLMIAEEVNAPTSSTAVNSSSAVYTSRVSHIPPVFFAPSTSPVPKNSFAKLLDDDNDVYFNFDDIVESSVAGETTIPSSALSSPSHLSILSSSKPLTAVPSQQEHPPEFNIDSIFGESDESTNDCFDKNIDEIPSDLSQLTQAYDVTGEKENSNPELPVKIVNSVVIVEDASPVKPRPNFAKLMNALKTSNFLSPSPSNFQLPSSSSFMSPSNAATSPSIVFNSPQPSKFKTSLSTPKITTFLVPSPVASTLAQSSFRRPFNSPLQSPVSSRAKKQFPKSKLLDHSTIVSDDNDDQDASTSFALPVRKKISRKRKRNDFFDTQAGVDGTDSSDEDVDETLDGFIANETINSSDDEAVDIHAQYLKSLRSPSMRQNGNFKMPTMPPPPADMMIYSQVPFEDEDEELDEEMLDFVVDNDEEHAINETMDELEIAEMMLKEKRKQAQRLRNRVKRRKVVRSIESSDEDDELTELRKQLNSNPD